MNTIILTANIRLSFNPKVHWNHY